LKGMPRHARGFDMADVNRIERTPE
jgi:hypothetical protein